jgi:hypothetical protein
MKRFRSYTACLTLTLLPALAHAAGYKFTSFQYPLYTGSTYPTVFTGIDDANRIAGYVNFPNNPQGFLITAAGSLATVNPPGYVYGILTAINRLGGIVGQAYDGSSYAMFEDNILGFGSLSGLLLDQNVTGINRSFDITGNYTNGSLQNEVYVRIKGVYHELLPARCSYTHDPAINDDDVVVGNCVTSSNASLGFIWRGKFTYFQPPAGAVYLQAAGINKAGVVAGWYTDASGFDHGFVLDGGTMTTVDYPGASNTQIWGINKAGKLVGEYFESAVDPSAFTATPQ